MKTDKAKKAEAKLLLQLQVEHGYMFMDMPRKSERTTTIFSRNRKTKETKLTGARVVSCAAPFDSWLALSNPISPTKRSK